MRTLFSMLVSGIVTSLVAACVLAPDSYNVTLRTGNRVGIQGMNFGATYNNPWKPRRVVEDRVPTEGGFFGGEAP